MHPGNIRCSLGTIRVIPWQRKPRADRGVARWSQHLGGFRANMTLAGRRYFSKPACNMKFAVASLLEKPGIHMKKTEKKMIIASLANNPMRMLKGRASTSSPAQSQQLPLHKWDRYKYSPPEIITFSTPPHTGKIRSIVRTKRWQGSNGPIT